MNEKSTLLINNLKSFYNYYYDSFCNVPDAPNENNILSFESRVSINSEQPDNKVKCIIELNLNDYSIIKIKPYDNGSKKYNYDAKHNTKLIVNAVIEQTDNEIKFEIENIKKAEEEKKENDNLYWYEYRLRGYSLGCQPNGHKKVIHDIGRHGIIGYDRPLTSQELNAFELTLYRQPENQTKETSYKVGNRSFLNYKEAESYCIQSDYDPILMIQTN